MKNILYFLVFVFLLSCSSNEEIVETHPLEAFYKEAIIGSWAIRTMTINGETSDYEHTEGCEKDLFQFYNEENKQFEFEELVVTNCPQCAECAITQTILNWELRGNKIDFYFGEQFVLQYTIIEVTETIFSYQFEFDINQDGQLDMVEVLADYYDPYGNFE